MTENMKAFEKRVKRIVKAHYGGKFSLKRRIIEGRKPLRFPMFHLLMFFGLTYCGLTASKIYMEREMGEKGFVAHLAVMADGDESARIAAKLLRPDRFMTFVESKI